MIKYLVIPKGEIIKNIDTSFEGEYSRKSNDTLLISNNCRFAYIEFSNKESVDNALKLDDTHFKGRQLKVRVLETI